jgi:hypothetical protein
VGAVSLCLEKGSMWGSECTSAISDADSSTVTSWPSREIDIAAPRPPRPAPMIITSCFLAW